MAQLPTLQTQDLTIQLMQTRWKALLDPLLSSQLLDGLLLTNLSLAIGANRINHLLGRRQIGWFLTDIAGPAQIYRSAPFDDKTLELTTNASVDINLWVF